MGFRDTIRHAFNAFQKPEEVAPQVPVQYTIGPSSHDRPDRPRFRMNSERTIIASIYTRMAIDVAGVKIEHVRMDDNGAYVETIKSGLNNCLNVEANLDQGARHLRTDIPLTMFQEGVVAIVPTDTTNDPRKSMSWDVVTLRVGIVQAWYPEQVLVRVYNQKKGIQEDILLPKRLVAIAENPFYPVMNEPNSTLKRLVHKLSLLDNIDEIASSGKLDIIIQLPYTVKTETRQKQAEKRRQDLEDQLKDSTYGVAWLDGTEKVTQLNRSVENNLLEQIKYLKEELYNELGLTVEIMNGTADDVAMLNYRLRTIEPIIDAITEAIARTFLTKTARSQGQSIMYFESPFRMLPISKLADVVDVLSRNQVVTPNEIRPVIGLKPSKEPQANQLINSNMPLDKQVTSGAAPADETSLTTPQLTTGPDQAEQDLMKELKELGV